MTTSTVQLFDPAEVRRALEVLQPAGQVTELRILNATTASDRWPHTASGYFDSPDKLVEALEHVHSATGFYLTPNPVAPALLARAANRIRKADKGATTSDGDIVARRWLLVDCDPQRPSGISATDAEHDAAIARAQLIADDLRYCYGWPAPVLADSGNGSHLLYRVDLPVDDGGLVQRCLAALAAKFDDDQVKVDTGVFNPARIWKLPGTLACKGDNTTDRPHRMARILSAPDSLQVVAVEFLNELASEAPKKGPDNLPDLIGNGKFDIDQFIQSNGFNVDGPYDYNGGRKWTFKESPLCDHHDDGPFLIQFGNGALAASCHHASCSWNWHDLRAKFQPKPNDSVYERLVTGSANGSPKLIDDTAGESVLGPAPVFLFSDLRSHYPKLNAPVVDGLFREGETVNVIANPKSGKSWLDYYFALCIITGRSVFDRFPTTPGNVLLIDNELHAPTLAYRIPKVAEAMGIPSESYVNKLTVIPLRGDLRSLAEMEIELQQFDRGQFSVMLWDAKYRFETGDENSNANEAALYNRLDSIARQSGAAQILIHHASKGSQSDKRITDVGAGAGAQSRAADCHIVLREHEEPGVVVLDAAVRSFPPVDPLAVKWVFPLFTPAGDVDCRKLKGNQSQRDLQQQARDREAMDQIIEALRDGSGTARQLRSATGFSRERLQRLLDLMESQGHLTSEETSVKGNKCHEYTLNYD